MLRLTLFLTMIKVDEKEVIAAAAYQERTDRFSMMKHFFEFNLFFQICCLEQQTQMKASSLWLLQYCIPHIYFYRPSHACTYFRCIVHTFCSLLLEHSPFFSSVIKHDYLGAYNSIVYLLYKIHCLYTIYILHLFFSQVYVLVPRFLLRAIC